MIEDDDPRANSPDMSETKRNEIENLLGEGAFRSLYVRTYLPMATFSLVGSYSPSNQLKTGGDEKDLSTC